MGVAVWEPSFRSSDVVGVSHALKPSNFKLEMAAILAWNYHYTMTSSAALLDTYACMVVFGPFFVFFDFTPTKCPTLVPVPKDNEASPAVQPAAFTVCILHITGCSREALRLRDGVLAECFRSLTARCAPCLSWLSKSDTLDGRYCCGCQGF